jgi:hypothetical protein
MLEDGLEADPAARGRATRGAEIQCVKERVSHTVVKW